MIPDFLIRPYRGKWTSRIAREIIHRAAPEEFFKAFMSKQHNPLNRAAYALTFDLDFESDYAAAPKLLDALKKYQTPAGFAVIGKFVEKYPDIHKRMADEGHELINHTHTHPDNPHWAPERFFNRLSYAEQREEITRCHEAILTTTGYECVGFRTPHFGNLHTETVYPILKELGYRYSSSTAACKVSGFGAPYRHENEVWEIPVGGSLPFPLAVFDSWNMLRKKRPMLPSDWAFVEEFRQTLAAVSENQWFLTHYFDPYDIVENGKLEGVLSALTNSGVAPVLYRSLELER